MENQYYHTKQSVEEYIEMAKDVSGINHIEKFSKYLSPASEILEIGSGPGTDWNILNKNYYVVGSDNSKEFLTYLKKENPTGTFLELDAVTLKTNYYYDCIYSNKVLHHLKTEDLKASIKRQYSLLKTDGIVCHSFWKGEDNEVFKGIYVNYHTEKELSKFFGDYFETLHLEEYNEFEDGDSILFIGRRKS
jgi:cyclopropane fatty-acyl-phospholipid synthase-like methyltransferase